MSCKKEAKLWRGLPTEEIIIRSGYPILYILGRPYAKRRNG